MTGGTRRRPSSRTTVPAATPPSRESNPLAVDQGPDPLIRRNRDRRGRPRRGRVAAPACGILAAGSGTRRTSPRPRGPDRRVVSVRPGPLAQSAEQRTFNPRVVGSTPTGPTHLTCSFAGAMSSLMLTVVLTARSSGGESSAESGAQPPQSSSPSSGSATPKDEVDECSADTAAVLAAAFDDVVQSGDIGTRYARATREHVRDSDPWRLATPLFAPVYAQVDSQGRDAAKDTARTLSRASCLRLDRSKGFELDDDTPITVPGAGDSSLHRRPAAAMPAPGAATCWRSNANHGGDCNESDDRPDDVEPACPRPCTTQLKCRAWFAGSPRR